MKKILAFALCIAMILALAACSGAPASSAAAPASSDAAPASSETPAAPDDAPAPAKLLLGTSADYPPFEFIYLDDNGAQQYAGIDISLGAKIAEDMGAEMEVVNISFDNLMASLQKGEIDMVIAGIEKTPERETVADFSDPYYTDLPAMILVKKENVGLYNSMEDFAGKAVGAQSGTTKADIVTNDMPGANPVFLQVVSDLVNNLVYDKCDAIVLDGAVAMQYAQSNEELVILESVPLGEALPFRVCVQKGDPSGLLPKINETIAAILADGTMDAYIAEADALSDKAIE